jgi:hypothetical protein
MVFLPLGGFPMSSRPTFDRWEPNLDVPRHAVLASSRSDQVNIADTRR